MHFQAEYQREKKRNIRSLDGAIMLFFTLLSEILEKYYNHFKETSFQVLSQAKSKLHTYF